MIPAQVEAIKKKDLELILDISFNESINQVNVDYFIPLFGLLPRLGPIANWGFKMEKKVKFSSNLDKKSLSVENVNNLN